MFKIPFARRRYKNLTTRSIRSRNRQNRLVYCVSFSIYSIAGSVAGSAVPQKWGFLGEFEKRLENPKNRYFYKEKVPKPYDFETSLVEISGIEPLTS